MAHQVVLHDSQSKQWLRFQDPLQVITTSRIEEVVSTLHLIETLVNQEGYVAAGFLSYEAAPAFDPVLPVKPAISEFPLLWFGVYREWEVIQLPLSQTSIGSTCKWSPSINRDGYDQAFHRIKQHLANGDTYQVNFTFRLRSPFSQNPWNFFLELVQRQQADFAAYLDTGRFAVCSASPEMFFQLDGHQLTSRPMKGTAARACTFLEDKAQADWLYHSEKNRAENVMIVDLIRNDMGRIAEIGSVKVTRLFDIERYPTVWQMTSTVTAVTNACLCQIFKTLFPCASITGAPKCRSMKIISNLESEPRQIYTGSIGYLAPNRKAQFNVAIRTVLIDRERNQAEYGVGGGIVWDSELGDEYQECLTKTQVLTHRQPDFSLFESLLWTPTEGFFLLARHLQRLHQSADYFGFETNQNLILKALEHHAESLPPTPHKVKLILTKDGLVTCESWPVLQSPDQPPVKLRLAATPVNSRNPFLYHKTTHRETYTQALNNQPDCDDVVFWNERGEITETTIANLVVGLNGHLVTPPIACGLLPGTFRNWLLEAGQIQEKKISLEEFLHSECIFLVNSVRKWRQAELVETITQATVKTS